jgi:divalent metal cation (Fe/Co/Zn/Cd) transporter
VAILFVLRGAATDVYRRLMDAVEPELVDAAEASLRGTPGVRDVDDVRLRWIGHRIRAEVGLVVDGELSMVEAHAVATEAHHRLLHDVPRLHDVTVHVGPPVEGDTDHHHAALEHHRRR